MNGLNPGEATPENVAKTKEMNVGGSLDICGPNFQNQTARVSGGLGAELDISLKKSDEEKVKAGLHFNFSECDVKIKSDFAEWVDTGGYEDGCPFHIIANNGSVELLLTPDQAATLGHFLNQFVQACSAGSELRKEIKISV